MFTSSDLKATITEIRPIIERQLDDAALVAGHRENVTARGGDWSQVKALVKAMIQDERDEAGGHKRVLAILNKADHALGYADMLGLGNLNEKNSFSDHSPDAGNMVHDDQSVDTEQDEYDAETGEIIENETVGNSHSNPSQAAMPAQTIPALPEEGAPELAFVESSALHPQPETAGVPEAAASGDNSNPVTVPSASPLTAEVTASADRSAALTLAAAPVERPDYTKPNPICADPDECGVHGSWNFTCGTCLRRAEARQHEGRAVH